MQCSKRPVNPSTRNPQYPKTQKHGRRLTTTHQRDTRRSGCGNGRNARNRPAPAPAAGGLAALLAGEPPAPRSPPAPRLDHVGIPQPGGKMSKRSGGIIGCKYKMLSGVLYRKDSPLVVVSHIQRIGCQPKN